jgi:TRAP-type C4-dicarboxylate transport system substrate-binding protein
MKSKHSLSLTALVLGVGLAASTATSAAEVKLKAGFFIPPSKSLFRIAFDKFVAKVNATGKGVLTISQVVGPESIARGQWCNSVKSGILDVGGLVPAYCANLIPGIEAMDVAVVPPKVQRTNGAAKLLGQLFSKRAGSHYLAQYGYGTKYHLLTRKSVASIADFKKLRLRTTPAYTSFFHALGSQTVRTRRGEVFTAMERGVVDGFANPLSEIRPMGWHKVSKYVIYPGFYNPIIIVLVNDKKWNSLNAAQKAVLTKAGMALENELSKDLAAGDVAQGVKLFKGGLKKISLSPADSKKFLSIARESRWKDVIKKSPKIGPQLKKLLTN